jgi:hypothetical protein
VRSRNYKTVCIVLIIAAFCVFSYRWYTSLRVVSGIETVNIGGVTIAITALTGYCNEVDPAFFAPLQRIDSSRDVIAVSAPCQELTAFKDGRAAGLKPVAAGRKALLTQNRARTSHLQNSRCRCESD